MGKTGVTLTAVESIRGIMVRLDDVSVRLGDRLALRNVSLDIQAGAFVGLIGANGSGKSTLLRAVLGILPLATGHVEVAGKSPDEARDIFAYLPQRSHLGLDLPLRAWDIVLMGRIRMTGFLGRPSREDREIAADALARVGLADRRNSPIGEMSFGQQQRVLFARALAQQGQLLLLDEPMNGVDPTTQELFLQVLESLHAEGKTVLMATHDLGQAANVCDRLIVLDGSLIAYGSVEETMSEEVLTRAYGVHFHTGPGDHILEDAHHHEMMYRE
jgi:ABC-type Mn2+/Zn2+ transport system ATPase subunit